MKKCVCRLAFIFTALLFSCFMSACANTPSTQEAHNFGEDEVPSITSVVGERTVIGEESEGLNEFPSKQYTYQSSSVSDDLLQYTQLLLEQGWTTTAEGYNLKEFPGSAQFAKESVDEDHILVINIAYEENQYSIKVTKLEAVIN